MRYSLVFLLSFLLVACSSDEATRIPDSVLSKEKMAEVLVDVHLLEAALATGSVGENGVSPTDLLKRHHVTKKQYDESFYFYSQNPLLLGEIYQLVLNELSKMQGQAMNKK